MGTSLHLFIEYGILYLSAGDALSLFGSKLGFRRILDSLYGAAFDYNSTEREPICIKSGALWDHCRRLALTDFGRDPRISDSLRVGEILFFFCEVSNAQFHRFPVGQTSRNLNTIRLYRWGDENCRNRILTSSSAVADKPARRAASRQSAKY